MPPGARRDLGGQLVGALEANQARHQRLVAVDRQHVGHVAFLQPAPQPAIAAVDLISSHPGDSDLGVQCPRQHPAGQLRLGVELDTVADAGLLAAWPVLGPALRQVQLPVHQPVPTQAGIGHKHADLAVLDPRGRARVLPLDPADLVPFFKNPVSSTTSTPPASPRCSTT
jgi:hypothetical protein